MAIPARLHFCWIGPALPWAYAFAILSAAGRSELPDIVLHHTDALKDSAAVRAVRATPGVRLAPLDPAALLRRADAGLQLGEGLAALHARLPDPVARSDVLRAAILYLEGGIYADLDTVTVASLRPLLGADAFLGSELIVWPPAARAARSPLRLARPVALDLVRKLLRHLPHGWKLFRHVERLYVPSLNNAVMGSAAGAPLMARYLRAMVALPPARQVAPYGLGPHLLCRVAGAGAGAGSGCDVRAGVTVHGAPVFTPLPPEISEHWFRRERAVDLASLLTAETRIVHWYASVHTSARVAAIDPAYVGRNREHQLYSALISRCVPDVARLA